jgi:dipeptidyl aminopeptidase/acylaminoacyl peptidase
MLGAWDGSLGHEVLSDVVHSSEEHGTALKWREDGLYFIGSERGTSNLYRTDGTVQAVTSGEHATIDFSIAEDGTIALTTADATHPAEVSIMEEERVRQLTHENEAFLNEVRIVTPRRLCFTGANGESSEGWLLAPPGHEVGKHPLIVYIHGGPQLAHGEAFFFEYQFLAGQGFGVFFPNIHGSSSYGGDYQTSIRGDWGNLDYQDVLAGAETAAAQEWVDESRMGIAGGSYGGYMTSWVMGHTDRFRAAVIERCLCNIVSFMGTSDGGWVWNRMFGVYPEEDVQKLWDMSPIKYVAEMQAPIMVIHSERDDRTPFEQGEQLFLALRRLGKDTKFVAFPEESHGLSRGGKPSRRVERMGHIVGWFKEKL